MLTPQDILSHALTLEKRLFMIYSIMVKRSKTTTCELNETLQMLYNENGIQVNIISSYLDNYMSQPQPNDMPETIVEKELITELKNKITDSKTAFQIAIDLENKILKMYIHLRKSPQLNTVDWLLRTLIHTKENHIDSLRNMMSSGIVEKICAAKSITSKRKTAQRPIPSSLA